MFKPTTHWINKFHQCMIHICKAYAKIVNVQSIRIKKIMNVYTHDTRPFATGNLIEWYESLSITWSLGFYLMRELIFHNFYKV